MGMFNALEQLPPFGESWIPYFKRTFDIYTKLNIHQNTHRTVLRKGIIVGNSKKIAMTRRDTGDMAAQISHLY